MPGSQYIIKYVSDITDATSGARRVQQINADMAKTISGQYAQATRVIGTSINKISETPVRIKGEDAIRTVSKLGTIVQTADGSYKEFTKTQTFLNGGLVKTSGSLKDVTGQFTRTNVETAKSQKNFLTFRENLARLGQRALLTIPVWIALRTAITGTFRVIRDGLKTIEEQDKALQKAKRTLQGTTSDIERNFGRLREAVTRLSLETGENIEKITNAFYKFSTVGFDFETSIKGAEYAVKSAIVQFGDAEETANAFARAMRVLVDRSEGAVSAGDQIAEAMALTTELWKSNAFELNEFTQSLEKFAGTAKATNFTTQQTIALLASLSTAGLRGGRAGRLLRTSVVKLLTNLDKLASTLGVHVNPQLDTTFDVLMRVLDAIQGLDRGSQVAQQTAEAIGEIFGGVRGMEAVLALKALRQELLKNLDTIGDVDELNKTYEEVSKTVNRQINIFHNLNREIGKTFVNAVVGGEDFADTLRIINDNLLPAIKDTLEELGELLNALGKYKVLTPLGGYLDNITEAREEQAKLFEEITSGLKGKLNREQLINLLARVRIEIEDNNIEVSPQTIQALEKKLTAETDKINIKPETVVNQTVEQKALSFAEGQDIAKLIRDYELEILKIRGASNRELLEAEDILTKKLNIQEKDLDTTERQFKLQSAVVEEWQQINELLLKNALNILQATGATTKELLEAEEVLKSQLDLRDTTLDILERESKKQEEITNENIKRNRLIINSQLELLRLRGATSLQLVQAEIELERIAGLNQDALSQLQKQLDLEREITKEREGQVNLSNESLKIFQIAQRYGTSTAKDVLAFLRGEIPVGTLPFGRQDLQTILEEFFPSELLQRRANRFFSGRGAGIGIQEQRAIAEFVPGRLVPSITLPEIRTNIDNIKIELKRELNREDLSARILEDLAEAIQANPTIKQSIQDIIEQY